MSSRVDDLEETTFGTPPDAAGCTVVDPRQVSCVPVVSALRGGRTAVAAAPVQDVTLVLPLDFPPHMVSDEVEVTATVEDSSASRPVRRTFRPARTPRFDFAKAPVSYATSGHTLSSDPDLAADRYDVQTTDNLPPRVRVATRSRVRPGSALDTWPLRGDQRRQRLRVRRPGR